MLRISDIPFHMGKCFSFFCSLTTTTKKKGFGPPLAKYIKLKRFKNLKIRHQASGRLICAKKESSQARFFLMFIGNLTIRRGGLLW